MKKRLIWITLFAVAVLASLSAVKHYQRQIAFVKDRESAALRTVARLEQQVATLEEQLQDRKDGDWTEGDWEELQNKELKHPVEDLVADLKKNKEIIPQKGVLGGTMAFEDVQFLGSRWAVASISDGHILGLALLKYRVSDDGRITWNVVDSYIQ